MVDLDFVPSGILEKMASGMRFVKRAVEADLARFKAYVELGDAEGLEYRSKPEEMEQHQGEDSDSESEDESSEQDSRSGQDDSAQDEAERESKQQERDSRRKERRESVTSG